MPAVETEIDISVAKHLMGLEPILSAMPLVAKVAKDYKAAMMSHQKNCHCKEVPKSFDITSRMCEAISRSSKASKDAMLSILEVQRVIGFAKSPAGVKKAVLAGV
jgi:hypothetical protein